jgi:penicillin-binding protein 1B
LKKRFYHRWLFWLAFTLLFAAIVTTIAVSYWAYQLNTVIVNKFEGRRWTVPAKVYANPLELYAGARISPAHLTFTLQKLRYSFGKQLAGPSTAVNKGRRILLHSRGFQFASGWEPAKRLEVSFNRQGMITRLWDLDKQRSVGLYRLAPLAIGGIYPEHNEDRILVNLSQVPPLLVDALIAAEDRTFYQNFGISPKGIIRASWINLRYGRWVQGGSTLTQQLVKNYFLNDRRTLLRKIKEAVMAVLLDYHYPKDEILQAYLNEVYLGQAGNRAIHGFALASQYYFAQPLQSLDISQQALLVSLVRGPSYYDPRRHPQRALKRRNLVLSLLAQQGFISQQQASTAQASPLGVKAKTSTAISQYPAFMDLVRQQLQKDYQEQDLTSEGLRIFTTLNPFIQHQAEQAVINGLEQLKKSKKQPLDDLESAVVVTSVEGGDVLALVSGNQPRYAGFNRALKAERSIGSLVKPAIYLTALESKQNYTLTTLLDDSPVDIAISGQPNWQPQNFSRVSHGMVPFYLALAHSYNQATVRLGMELGVDQVIKTVHRLGVGQDWPNNPSILLGTAGLTPFDVAKMYHTIANGGFRAPLRAIREVVDAQGRPLTRYPLAVKQVVDPADDYLLTFAMEQVMRQGTGRSAYWSIPSTINLAGKTGTTSNLMDSWFAGFSQNYVTVVWVGRDSSAPTPFTGATGALRIWSALVKSIAPVSLSPIQPTNIVMRWTEAETGLISGPDCPDAIQIPYLASNAPPQGTSCQQPADGDSDQSLSPLGQLKHWLAP